MATRPNRTPERYGIARSAAVAPSDRRGAPREGDHLRPGGGGLGVPRRGSPDRSSVAECGGPPVAPCGGRRGSDRTTGRARSGTAHASRNGRRHFSRGPGPHGAPRLVAPDERETEAPGGPDRVRRATGTLRPDPFARSGSGKRTSPAEGGPRDATPFGAARTTHGDRKTNAKRRSGDRRNNDRDCRLSGIALHHLRELERRGVPLLLSGAPSPDFFGLRLPDPAGPRRRALGGQQSLEHEPYVRPKRSARQGLRAHQALVRDRRDALLTRP